MATRAQHEDKAAKGAAAGVWHSPALPRGMLPVLCVLLCSTFVAATAGLIASIVLSLSDGQHGNQFSAMWLCAFAGVMAVQAAAVLFVPRTVTARPARYWAWLVYATLMATYGFILLVCYGIALPSQAGWAVLWLVIAPVIAFGTQYQQQRKFLQVPQNLAGAAATAAAACTASQPPPAIDVEAGAAKHGEGARARCCCSPCPVRVAGKPLPASAATQKPPLCSTAAWHAAGTGCASCLGWSSLFWLLLFGFFMVLQGAWLAHDLRRFPPPGQLLQVPIDGSDSECLSGA